MIAAKTTAPMGSSSAIADVNGDGVTNSLDALMVLQAAIGAIAL